MNDLDSMWSSLVLAIDANRPIPADDRAGPSGEGREPTPVTVLTGFLGAGKSTLLAHLLVSPPGDLRIGAVVNDIGALRFDPSMVAVDDKVQIELTNGCGCCSAAGGLLAALRTKREADVVVLEASGVADPFAIALLIEAEPDLQLDRIVTVVDASNLDPGLGPGGPIVSRQLDAANVVVATHLDRVTVEQRTSAIDRLAAHVLGRPVLPSTADEPEVAALLPGGITGAHPGPAHNGAGHGVPATSAVDGHITAITVDNPRPIAVDELAALVGADFTTRSRRPPGLGGKPEVLRLKGTLLVDGTASFVQLTPSTAVVEPIANATPEHGTSAGGTQLGVTIVAATRADAEALADRLA